MQGICDSMSLSVWPLVGCSEVIGHCLDEKRIGSIAMLIFHQTALTVQRQLSISTFESHGLEADWLERNLASDLNLSSFPLY